MDEDIGLPVSVNDAVVASVDTDKVAEGRASAVSVGVLLAADGFVWLRYNPYIKHPSKKIEIIHRFFMISPA